MKKPALVLVPSPPKPAPGEVRMVPYHGSPEPFDPTKGFAIVERKRPYLTVVCSREQVPAGPGSSLDE